MNHAHKGRRREHASRRLLEHAGYHVCRSAGSKGVADLVAWSATELLLVSVRANRGLSPTERDALLEVPAPPHTRRLLHRWRDGEGTPEVVELAATPTRCGTRSPRATRCRRC